MADLRELPDSLRRAATAADNLERINAERAAEIELRNAAILDAYEEHRPVRTIARAARLAESTVNEIVAAH